MNNLSLLILLDVIFYICLGFVLLLPGILTGGLKNERHPTLIFVIALFIWPLGMLKSILDREKP